jgi:hypothetical protein
LTVTCGERIGQYREILEVVASNSKSQSIASFSAEQGEGRGVLPDMVNGIKQKPIEGVSMAYTFDQANANAPSKRDTQYFEMVGNRAIYHDGWVAATTPPFPPWAMGTGKLPDALNGYKWELYNIANDYSEYNDLAASNPSKLKELQALFMTEAGKYQVFPMDNVLLARLVTERPSATAGQTEFTYTGENSGIPVANAPSILDKDYTITADITVPSGDAEGMIVIMGGRFGGYGLFLSHSWNWFLKNHWLELAILGLFILGVLFTLFGKNRRWKTWKLSFGYAMLAVVGLWAVAVLATSVCELGLTPKLSAIVAGDAGGGSARLDYQVAGLLGYKLGRKVVLLAGHRYLAMDYRPIGNAGYIYDVAMPGLMIGAAFNLK